MFLRRPGLVLEQQMGTDTSSQDDVHPTIHGVSEVREDQKVSTPSTVADLVMVDPALGETFWHYRTDAEVLLLANQSMSEEHQRFLGTSKFYDEKESGERDIRPPQEVRNQAWEFDVGDTVFFLSYPDMTTSAPKAVYLLDVAVFESLLPDGGQFLDLLPVEKSQRLLNEADEAVEATADGSDTDEGTEAMAERTAKLAWFVKEYVQKEHIQTTIVTQYHLPVPVTCRQEQTQKQYQVNEQEMYWKNKQ